MGRVRTCHGLGGQCGGRLAIAATVVRENPNMVLSAHCQAFDQILGLGCKMRLNIIIAAVATKRGRDGPFNSVPIDLVAASSDCIARRRLI